MKLDINYVLNGQFIAKTVYLRSLDTVLARAEKAGAWAITVTPVTYAKH